MSEKGARAHIPSNRMASENYLRYLLPVLVAGFHKLAQQFTFVVLRVLFAF